MPIADPLHAVCAPAGIPGRVAVAGDRHRTSPVA